MDYRKIIEFGKSSYVVSLPKDWLTDAKLGKGDVVYVTRQGNALMFLPAENTEGKKVRRVTIDVSGMTKEEIRLQLVSKYIRSFNEITLTSDNMPAKAKDIRAIIHDLMALEVIEEDSSKIVTKDFIHTDEIDPLELVHKMDIITREMLSDSKNTFVEDNHMHIHERDSDVNRLSYLLFRKMRGFEREPQAFRKMKWTNSKFLSVWSAGVNIEKIADDVKRISKLMKRLKFKQQEQEQFVKLYSLVEKYYVDGMTAFYEEDSEKALKLITQRKRMIKQCRDFYRQNWNHEWVPIVMEKFKSIMANTKAMLTYVCDMD